MTTQEKEQLRALTKRYSLSHVVGELSCVAADHAIALTDGNQSPRAARTWHKASVVISLLASRLDI